MRIALTNFLCYPVLTVDFEPGVHLLTGPTGAGKSAVLQSVEYVITGKARGYDLVKDRAYLKGAAEKPMTVRAHFGGNDWPLEISRGSKLTTEPAEWAARLDANEDLHRLTLGAWQLLDAKAKDRAAALADLLESFDPERVMKELATLGPVPPAGKYNELTWGGFDSVAAAEKQASAIRASYFQTASGKVPDELLTRVATKEAALKALRNVAKPAEDSPEIKEAGTLNARIQAAEADLQRLGSEAKLLTWLQEAVLRNRPKCTCGEVSIEAVTTERIAAPRGALVKQLETMRERLTALQPAVNAHQAAVAAWRNSEGERLALTKELGEADRTVQSVKAGAEDAGKRRAAWDKIVKALAADGPVGTAISQKLAQGVDMERLAWSSNYLGIDVRLSTDGTVTIDRMGDRQPSRGQRLLAGIALQDALCQAVGTPVLLIDELETLDPALRRLAVSFMVQVADDYDAIFAAVTTPANFKAPADMPEGVRVWRVAAGRVESLSTPALAN